MDRQSLSKAWGNPFRLTLPFACIGEVPLSEASNRLSGLSYPAAKVWTPECRVSIDENADEICFRVEIRRHYLNTGPSSPSVIGNGKVQRDLVRNNLLMQGTIEFGLLPIFKALSIGIVCFVVLWNILISIESRQSDYGWLFYALLLVVVPTYTWVTMLRDRARLRDELEKLLLI